MIELAVITGQKPHDVIGFHELFRGLDGINAYIQHLDDFASAGEMVRDRYDAVLSYFMFMEGPTDEGLPGYCGRPKSALARLGETGQGIVLLHHGLLAYPQWPAWDEISGIKDRNLQKYKHDQGLEIHIADPTHPITEGLEDWRMVDETYLFPNTGPGSRVLLTTDHPGNVETIAWVREYKKSRVFCLQLGHDRQAWENLNFKTVLARGILWSCGRL